MKNGRENRNNGNQEKGKEEKEALTSQQEKEKGGRRKRPLSFCSEGFAAKLRAVITPADSPRALPRGLQLKVRSPGDNFHIAVKIVEHHLPYAVSPLFAGSDCINRKLQALVRVFLRPCFSGFVVDNGYGSIGAAVHPVNSPRNLNLTHLQVEPFFCVQNFS